MRTLTTGRTGLLVVGALAVALWSTHRADGQPSEAEWWKGAIEAPGQVLDIAVKLVPEAGGTGGHGTIDIPVQGARGLALTAIEITADALRFTLPPPPGAPPARAAVFELKRSADGKTATGDMKQSGLTMPVHLERTTEAGAQAVGPARPQTPKPPFPYAVREVTYENPMDNTKLAGALTIPEGAGPHPAVILISGSGTQDRDETIFGHKPFLVWADHLTRHGIAVLRVDDRGVGGSSGSVSDSTSKDFANDVIAGLKFLQKQPEIDRARIGLVGHSEGGLIAPLVASRVKDVACIVLLAGPGLPGAKLLNLQLEAILRAAGVRDADVERQSAAQRHLLELVVGGADKADVRAATETLVRIQLEMNGMSAPAAETLKAQIDAAVAQVQAPWMVWFLKHDPRPVLEKVSCPVLALIGSLDLQVPPAANLPELEAALKKAGNGAATVKELPKLNHLFQEATTGQVAEYATIEQTLADTALNEVTTWLRTQFKLTP